jgi:cytochrome c oxidase assembly factor CtaG/cytochrome c2
MMLHAAQALAPHDLWRVWSFEPAVFIALSVTSAVYARGLRIALSRARRARSSLTRESLFFISGLSILALALTSPLHAAGSVLFSAHMIQHEVLMAVAAPLLVLGRPGAPLIWGLPVVMRRPVGRIFSAGILRMLWSVVTRPFVAFLLHGAAIWVWHAPQLYDASVTSNTVHVVQHSAFLFTAIFFWWSVFPSDSRKGVHGYGVLYLFLTVIHTTLLGALLSLADAPLYPVYHDALTLPWGLSALQDQQLGGLIMWVPGGIVYLAAALWLMLRLIRESAARVARLEAARQPSFVNAAVRTVALLVIIAAVNGCTNHDEQWAAEMTGGTPSRGRETIRNYGCQSCHTIPGVTGAHSLVGPPLAGIASRSYIAGVLSNTPVHMIEWLRNPPGIDSKTAMPNMNVTERDARDIAAYLYTLR